MSERQEIRVTLDSCTGGRGIAYREPPERGAAGGSIPRIARLMALAIRLEGFIRDGTIQDYAEAARLGRVSRARITQIMKLLNLAPDLQEAILFLSAPALTERRLRPVTAHLDWEEQRRLFPKFFS